MTDYDYINDNMGGFDEDGLPNFMSAPGFDDDGYGNVDYAVYKLEGHDNKLIFRNVIGILDSKLGIIPYMDGVNNEDLVASRDFYNEAYNVTQSAYLDFADVWYIKLSADEKVFSIVTIGEKGVQLRSVNIDPFEIEDEESWEASFRYNATGLKDTLDMYRFPFLKRIHQSKYMDMLKKDAEKIQNKYSKED